MTDRERIEMLERRVDFLEESLKETLKQAHRIADLLIEGTKKHEPQPQTDCGDFADRLAYERGVKHAWEVAQKVFGSTVTFYEAEDVAKQIAKDEPQTDCAWK